jgi:hypothetical protein
MKLPIAYGSLLYVCLWMSEAAFTELGTYVCLYNGTWAHVDGVYHSPLLPQEEYIKYLEQQHDTTHDTQTNLDLRNKNLGYGFHSNVEIIERFQSKALRMIVDASWFVPNTVIRRDLQTPTVKEKSAATALNTVLASVHTQTA